MTTEPSTLQAVRRRLARARARRRADRRAARVGVCVVGPGKHFLSGMTYHTYGLVTALAAHGPTDAILLRNLVPRRLYPGESRVGADLSHLRLPPEVRRAERVDWWWVPGIFEAAWLLLRRPPAVLVVQWWSAAVWHTQLALVTLARLTGAKIVIEVHETIDSAESRHKLAGMWVRYLAPRLLAQADRVVVHSQADRALVTSVLDVEPERIEVVPEPPFDSYHLATPVRPTPDSATHRRPVELLFFGTIRPYKGLEDLVSAFDLLCDRDAGDHWRLTVVGETWEGWTEPNRRIAASPHRDRITFVNRYVPDEEVDGHFAAADVVVLPYHRSSTSGPLMVALSYGKPAVVTTVGGLPEAVEGYQGAVLVPPRDPMALAKGIVEAEHLIGTVHEAPRSWVDVAADHEAMYRRLGVRGRS
jgi:glycosyltransferase involved in cell wall biosynthesis